MGHLPKLPELYQRLKQLEHTVSELSARLNQGEEGSKSKVES